MMDYDHQLRSLIATGGKFRQLLAAAFVQSSFSVTDEAVSFESTFDITREARLRTVLDAQARVAEALTGAEGSKNSAEL